jgi:ABC-2 type transport system permease protein
MNRFLTLLQREWIQHQRGWTILLLLPLVLIVLVGAVFGFQLEFDEGSAPGPLAAVMWFTMAVTVLTVALAWGATLLMSPGLARRDVQDRSIEFWVSLPSSHSQSVGATLLMHLLALPLAAVVVGVLGSLLVSPLLIAKGWGIGEWFGLPWGQLLAAASVLIVRMVVGVVLATLWLSPLILGTMAASAWLKRWGVPAVIGGVVASAVLLQNVYGITLVRDVLAYLGRQAAGAMAGIVAGDEHGTLHLGSPDAFADFLPSFPGWLLDDAGLAIQALFTPGFALTLAAGAAAFALLVWRRQRGM